MEGTWTNRELADQYETAIQLLELIRVDYTHARKQLQDVSMRFSEREAVASKQLRIALEALEQTGTGYNQTINISSHQAFPRQTRIQKRKGSSVPTQKALPAI